MNNIHSLYEAASIFTNGDLVRPPEWYASFYDEEYQRCLPDKITVMISMKLEMRMNVRRAAEHADFLQSEKVRITDQMMDSSLGLACASVKGDRTAIGHAIDTGLSNGSLTQADVQEYFERDYLLALINKEQALLDEKIVVAPMARQSHRSSGRTTIPKVAGRQWPKVFLDESLPLATIASAIQKSFSSLFLTTDKGTCGPAKNMAVIEGSQFSVKDYVITLYFYFVKHNFSPWRINVSAYRDYISSVIGGDYVLTVQAYAPIFKLQTQYQCGLHEISDEMILLKKDNECYMNEDQFRYWLRHLQMLETHLKTMPYFENIV